MIYIDFNSTAFAPTCTPCKCGGQCKCKKNTSSTPCPDKCAWDRQDYPVPCDWIKINECPKNCSCGSVNKPYQNPLNKTCNICNS